MSSTKDFPPYSYVTGKFPHPTRDEQGHSFGVQEERVRLSDADGWPTCEAYLWGIELFNRGYYWEAHESWEAVWHAVGRRGTVADFCKALIKLAAAGVKAREGRPDGTKRHATRAQELLRGVQAHVGDSTDAFMGLRLHDLIQNAERITKDADSLTDTSDAPVVVVMPFALAVEE